MHNIKKIVSKLFYSNWDKYSVFNLIKVCEKNKLNINIFITHPIYDIKTNNIIDKVKAMDIGKYNTAVLKNLDCVIAGSLVCVVQKIYDVM